MANPMTEEILSSVSMSDIAARLGTDEDTARQATEAALPTLLAGLTAQASDPARALGLASALRQDHDESLLNADDAVRRVDPEEGDKILGHVFGERRGAVEHDLQGFLGGGSGDLVGKLMPMLAPLVMAYMKKKMTGGGSGGGGGLGDILGSVLGGGAAGQATGGGGGLGDILGSVLGGGDAPEQDRGDGGGIGDILGSVFGGGKEDESTGGGGVLDDVLDGIRDKQKKASPLDDILGSILGRR